MSVWPYKMNFNSALKSCERNKLVHARTTSRECRFFQASVINFIDRAVSSSKYNFYCLGGTKEKWLIECSPRTGISSLFSKDLNDLRLQAT